MSEDQPTPLQPHIRFLREPDREPPRRKREWRGPRGIPSRNRPMHGRSIKQGVQAAVATASSARQSVGIAPDRLLVLEFSSWDSTCRDVFESRFDATVVDEQIQERAAAGDLISITVQFPSLDAINQLYAEAEMYRDNSGETTHLPPGIRRSFFDGLDNVAPVSRSDRMGNRLTQEGFPNTAPFDLDVDLWHPGTPGHAQLVIDNVSELCAAHGGRIDEEVRTKSLLLARVTANRSLGDALLDLDWVARVNLPPRLPGGYGALLDGVEFPSVPVQPRGDEPLVAVIDSGVLPGHPLLRGWIVEGVDFASGENTPVDLQGHGTQVAGLVVYGSVAECMSDGAWTPEVLVANAKVLRCHPFDDSAAVFPNKRRPEALVEGAIRHFHETRGCRVFNLSVGNPDDVYSGGRQFAWAELLDTLARELNVVIVVCAGNELRPAIPADASTRDQFQVKVRDQMLSNASARICNPGTAAIAVTVGAVVRSDLPRTEGVFPGAPLGAPAPFSRVGPGYQVKDTQRGVKPDLVAYGGNYGVRGSGGNAEWVRGDIHLGEPTTRLDADGRRLLTAISGTSFAAPQVSNAAARALAAGTAALGTPDANVARAILGVTADAPPCGRDWLRDSNGKENWDKLRLVGYGLVNGTRVRGSVENDVCLIGSDTLPEDRWHVFSVPVPEQFLTGRGPRGISVALAFDPPVRASRKEYLARTMWMEVMKGLTIEELEVYRTPYRGAGETPKPPTRKILVMQPAKTQVQWSTLQVRRKVWTRPSPLPLLEGDERSVLHLLVGCQSRFPHGEGTEQQYGVAIRFWHSNADVELYQELRTRIRRRVVVAARAQAVV